MMLMKRAGQPFGVLRLQAGPAIAAHALHLAALDRDGVLAHPRIAGHDLELRAEQIVLHHRQVVGRRALGRAGDDQFVRQQVLEVLHRRILARDAHVGVAVGAADIDELARVVRRRHVADQRLQDGAGKDGADGGAVLRRQRIDVAGGLVAAGARHVLRHDRRVAGNVAADVPRDLARIGVVAAAGRRADHDGDLLAPVEFLDGILGSRTSREQAMTASEAGDEVTSRTAIAPRS